MRFTVRNEGHDAALPRAKPNTEEAAAITALPASPKEFCAAAPSERALVCPAALVASVARVTLKRSCGCVTRADLTRCSSAVICAADWPASMSKSTPRK
jgi:hypothetical protein